MPGEHEVFGRAASWARWKPSWLGCPRAELPKSRRGCAR